MREGVLGTCLVSPSQAEELAIVDRGIHLLVKLDLMVPRDLHLLLETCNGGPVLLVEAVAVGGGERVVPGGMRMRGLDGERVGGI